MRRRAVSRASARVALERGDRGQSGALFYQSDEVCETSYKDRGGKYQGQTGVTLPRT